LARFSIVLSKEAADEEAAVDLMVGLCPSPGELAH